MALLVGATGDMLRLDTAIPNVGTEGGHNAEAEYPNGRRPNHDVVDYFLTVINNRVFQGRAPAAKTLTRN